MPKPYQPPPIDWHQQPLLKATTVAKILNVTPQHVREMIHDGRLEAVPLPLVRPNAKHRDKYRVITASLLKTLTQRVCV